MRDPYRHSIMTIDRLVKEWKKYGRLIVGFDFDNTVFDYHEEGHTFDIVARQLKTLGHMGCEMICFTSCDPSRYSMIEKYLKEKGIPCHGINIDSKSVPFKGRKIYYNVFYDDRAGLGQVYKDMEQVIKKVAVHSFDDNISPELYDDILIGKRCYYSGKKFMKGSWGFINGYPACFKEFRKERDIIPAIEDIIKLFDK